MGESWKDILLILGGVFLLWWLEKKHQMMMLQMGYGVAQAPLYPNQQPTQRPSGMPATPMCGPSDVDQRAPFWASGSSGRPYRMADGGGMTPIRLLLQFGNDNYELGPRSRNGVNYG